VNAAVIRALTRSLQQAKEPVLRDQLAGVIERLRSRQSVNRTHESVLALEGPKHLGQLEVEKPSATLAATIEWLK
jgi:hypothetical protein